MFCLSIVLATGSNADPALSNSLDAARAAYAKKDYSKALSIWQPLADAGNAEAQRYVGVLYENGFLVPRDGPQAVAWYRKAAAQNDAEAEYRLGVRFVTGDDGLPKDVAQGLELMTKAGEQGYVRSFSVIGDIYRRGADVPKDLGQAAAWYHKAADLGYPLAQLSLAVAYDSGSGVPKDIKQARYWFRKAAEQNDEAAQFILGRNYEYGIDTESVSDLPIALCWYRKAAHGAETKEALKAVARIQGQVSSEKNTNGCK
jgi:TPR repeat protein